MIHESVPQDEKPFQRKRRQRVGLIALGLFVLSAALELYRRNVDPFDLLDGLWQAAISAVDPGSTFPDFDFFANLFGLIAVLRNLIPAFVMFVLILWFGSRFLQALHGLANLKEAGDYLRTSLFGWVVGPGPFAAKLSTTLAIENVFGELIKSKPFIIVTGGQILGGEHQPLVRIGGPASLIVHNDSAVLLERAGRLTRVVGPSFGPLRRFEKIRAIVDLRPRWYPFTVSGQSREGIPVKWPINVHFQINDEGKGRHEAKADTPYAYSEEALFKATTDYWVREFERTDHQDWRDRLIMGEAEGTLRNIMADLTLDQLIQAPRLPQLLNAYFEEVELEQLCAELDVNYASLPDTSKVEKARGLVLQLEFEGRAQELIDLCQERRPNRLWDEAIYPREQLEVVLRKNAANHGAKILDLTLDNVQMEDPVDQQWLETWKAKWKNLSMVQLAEGKARGVQLAEETKARAEQEMLRAIVEGLQDLVETGQPIGAEIILLRFTETVRRIAADPFSFPFRVEPNSAVQALRSLRDFFESTPPELTAGEPGPAPLPPSTPAQPSRPLTPSSPAGRELFEDLLAKARGDRELVERLIAFERRQDPGASVEELLQRAIDRWERDNR